MSITDNIVVMQELIHSMRKKQGRKGWMLLKIDLKKVYDRLRWDFIKDTLVEASFPSMWVSWIRTCVQTSSMRLLWNGELTDLPTRGIRQGDPISPYIFVLCMERLSHLINIAIAEKHWKPIKISRHGPKMSHVLLVDDIILVTEASGAQMHTIMHVLDHFYSSSGIKVSASKSKLFVSKNVGRATVEDLQRISGFKATSNLGSYLGMPVLHSKVSASIFTPLLDKVNSRLASWKGKFLSFAGRITLASSVLLSIPIYSMATIVLPKKICDGIDNVVRNFIWNGSRPGNRIYLVSWEEVCNPKKVGGLGFRFMRNMNLAIIGKLGWKFMTEPSSIWSSILRAKYVRDSGLCPANPTSGLVCFKVFNKLWLMGAGGLSTMETQLDSG